MCYCGDVREFEQCCGLLINQGIAPKTAEALMRSRYTAHVLGKVDYIVNTCHPDVRHEHDAAQIKAWCEQSEWLGLTIVKHKNGLKKAEVEFIARYRHQGETIEHHEHSIFKKHKNRWYFYQGS